MVTGLKFVFQVYDDQSAAIEAVKDGNADIVGIFSSGITQAYNNNLIITRKYASVSMVMITDAGKDAKSIKTVAVKERSRLAVSKNLPDDLKRRNTAAL